jgi:hypothetical protein
MQKDQERVKKEESGPQNHVAYPGSA